MGDRGRVELRSWPRPVSRQPGERVYEVNPRWTAERRRSARKAGKSDRLDAHAVAKLVRDEACTLPRVTAEDESVVLDLLVTEREAALTEATRLRNQLHQLLLQVDPDYRGHLPSLTTPAGVRAVEEYTGAPPTPLSSSVPRRSAGSGSASASCWSRPKPWSMRSVPWRRNTTSR